VVVRVDIHALMITGDNPLADETTTQGRPARWVSAVWVC